MVDWFMIANEDVPCEGPIVREHHRVAHLAIVPNMTVGEKGPAIPDACLARASSASIDGDEFAKRVFLADFQVGWLTTIFQILGLLTDGAISVKLISSARRQRPTQCDMHSDLTPARTPPVRPN